MVRCPLPLGWRTVKEEEEEKEEILKYVLIAQSFKHSQT
jgi:uncharacterized protein YbdZ (MbtH family)